MTITAYILLSIDNSNFTEETIHVEWSDHISEFNTSWLRGEDISQLPTELLGQPTKQSWGGGFSPPQHDYNEDCHDINCKTWMEDLHRYGVLIINGVPPNHEGLRSVLHTIGPLNQRLHPTNIFRFKNNYNSGEKVDTVSYGSGALDAHTDGVETQSVTKLGAFLFLQYSAPEKDTFSIVVDGLRVAEEFQKEYPEYYGLLSTFPQRYGRLRLLTEEDCPEEDIRIYQRHSVVRYPVIETNQDGSPKRIHLRHIKHMGLELSGVDEESYLAYYKSYKLFQDKLNDPGNQARFVMRRGMLLLFDNHRICHGRTKIFPSTTRSMIGAHISEEVYQSRYRLLLSQQSRLEPKWVIGCSTKTLEALANRFLP